MEAVCNQEGNWEPDPVQVCSSMWKPMSALDYAQRSLDHNMLTY